MWSRDAEVGDGESLGHCLAASRSRSYLCAAVEASSRPAPCIHERTAFMPPIGSSFMLLPLLWMLSWIPNMNADFCFPLSILQSSVLSLSIRRRKKKEIQTKTEKANQRSTGAQVSLRSTLWLPLCKQKTNREKAKRSELSTSNTRALVAPCNRESAKSLVSLQETMRSQQKPLPERYYPKSSSSSCFFLFLCLFQPLRCLF